MGEIGSPARFHLLSSSPHLPPSPQEGFTDPFSYTPHPLCREAAQQVLAFLDTEPGLKADALKRKMMGVLVCRGHAGRTGFLAAFSGLLDGKSDIGYFVPPILDLTSSDSFFKKEELVISALNRRIASIEGRSDPSAAEKEEILSLRKERKQRSQALQRETFGRFILESASKEKKSVLDIFRDAGLGLPPSATGDCAAPRLLQEAFRQGLLPLCMGEFWVGASPKGTIRRHGCFYPACQAKCRPILGFMLSGMRLKEEDHPTVHESSDQQNAPAS